MPDPISLFNGVPKAAAAAKKKRTKLTKKIAPSIFSSPNRTDDRSYDRSIAGAFDRLIV